MKIFRVPYVRDGRHMWTVIVSVLSKEPRSDWGWGKRLPSSIGKILACW